MEPESIQRTFQKERASWERKAGTKLVEAGQTSWVPGILEGLGERRQACVAAGQGHTTKLTFCLTTAGSWESYRSSTVTLETPRDTMSMNLSKSREEAILVQPCLIWNPQQLKLSIPTGDPTQLMSSFPSFCVSIPSLPFILLDGLTLLSLSSIWVWRIPSCFCLLPVFWDHGHVASSLAFKLISMRPLIFASTH